MQVLIIYYSRTGNTKKFAYEIAKGVESIKDVKVVVKTCEEVQKEDFIKSEGVIVGSPVYFGTMAAEVKKVLDDFIGTRRKMEDKVGAAFATSAHHTGGKETTILSILEGLLIYGMIVVGDPLSSGGHYGAAFAGEMTDKSQKEAQALGARVASLVKKLN
ncbi:MAG: NAD(P)H-dependent oxidoreductase [Candidatus Cloacimonetes bacterium]|nr:NAD(P)H-dependent oxidoreductase [Candidatus Cloacimonadota bacterium]